ncbi:MAG: hypothetical protein ABH812_00825 [bacterium]
MLPILLVSNSQNKINFFIKKHQKNIGVNDDFTIKIHPQGKEFSINQIKEIKKSLAYSVTESRLYILYNFDSSSYEAQNAFLKTLEEHSPQVHFILVVSQYNNFVPTLVSRSKIIVEQNNEDKINPKIVSELDKLIKNKDLKILGNKVFQAKGKKNPVEIFDGMIFYLKTKLEKDPKITDILRELITFRSYVLYNNVDAQNAIDHVLIYIYNQYSNS